MGNSSHEKSSKRETNSTDKNVTEASVTDTNVTEPNVTDTNVTEPNVTEENATETYVTGPNVTEPPVTDINVTGPSVTEPSVTDKPVTAATLTGKTVSETNVTDKNVTETNVTESIVTGTPVTGTTDAEPNVTDKPVTDKNVTEASVTKTTEQISTRMPSTTQTPNIFNVTGCEFGDKRDECLVENGMLCYEKTVRYECCYTCANYKVNITGCAYGDKLKDCRTSECANYTTQGQRNCCFTCASNNAKSTTSTTSLKTPLMTSATTLQGGRTTGSSGWTNSRTEEHSGDVPGWVVPMISASAVIVVLLVVVIVIILNRRRNKLPQHLSPIDEKNYNDYKMSKRAPMALPRGPESGDRFQERKPSAEYAYINPDDISRPDNSNRPLPPTPDAPPEYLELEPPSSTYSYADTAGVTKDNSDVTKDTADLVKDTPNAYMNRETDKAGQHYNGTIANGKLKNAYQKFPTAPTYSSSDEHNMGFDQHM